MKVIGNSINRTEFRKNKYYKEEVQMTTINEIKKLIGNTPLVKLKYRYKKITRYAYFKCEWYNFTGSIKDRAALGIIKSAYKKGELKKGQIIVETTSGNMGISMSAIGTALGHKVVIFMPSFMGEERKRLIKLYGAELRLVESFEEGLLAAKRLQTEEGAFLPMQFENEENTLAHYSRTAKEIIKQTNGRTKAFVAGVGTGGTLMGIGRYLKERLGIPVITVEPESSKQFSTGVSHGKHKLQGLSDGFIPSLYKHDLVDRIVGVSDDDAYALAQKLSRELGLGVGISSGANFAGIIKSGINYASSVFPDDSKKYLLSGLGATVQSSLADEVELIRMTVTSTRK